MSELAYLALYTVLLALVAVFGVHHFIKARRALRTGVTQGIMIGYRGEKYDLEYDTEAFRVNLGVRIFAVIASAIILSIGLIYWGIFVSAYLGYPTL